MTAPFGSWAEVAQVMCDIDPDFDWDSWKDEMKEEQALREECERTSEAEYVEFFNQAEELIRDCHEALEFESPE